MSEDSLYYLNDRISKRSYCCLSLRMGVLFDAIISLLILFVSEASFEYKRGKVALDFQLPLIDNVLRTFDILAMIMYTFAIIGCIKKSHNMIRYYKYFLWLECAMDLFHHIRSTNNIRPIQTTEVESSEVDPDVLRFFLIILVFVPLMGFQIVSFAQKVYSAFVASWYELYLATICEQAQIKEMK